MVPIFVVGWSRNRKPVKRLPKARESLCLSVIAVLGEKRFYSGYFIHIPSFNHILYLNSSRASDQEMPTWYYLHFFINYWKPQKRMPLKMSEQIEIFPSLDVLKSVHFLARLGPN